MGYVAAFLEVTGRRCIVVGGGAAALERSRMLLTAGASVILVAERLDPALRALAEQGAIEVAARPAPEQIRQARLIYVTEPDAASAQVVIAQAQAARVELNVSDRPAQCSFIAPATLARGALQVAISSGGASPTLTKVVRDEISEVIGEEYGPLVEILAAARPQLRRETDLARRAELAAALIGELRAALRTQADAAALEEIVRRRLGHLPPADAVDEFGGRSADR